MLAGNGVRALVSSDLVLVLEREADVVESVQQAMLAKWLDVELQRKPWLSESV